MFIVKCATTEFHLLFPAERPAIRSIVAHRHSYKRDEPEEPVPWFFDGSPGRDPRDF